MRTNLIVDVSNVVYSSFFGNEAKDETVPYSMLMTLNYINKFFKMYNPDKVILAFDDYSWRKAYTKNLDECVTHKKYKDNRRKKLTPKQEELLAILDEHVIKFYDILAEKTSLVTLKRKYLEADDLIAGFVQKYNNESNIIVSSDKDFIQLLKNKNVRLLVPTTEIERTLDEWDGNADLFMFEKCLRGDTGDWVQSAYPRLQKKKIIKAFDGDIVLKENIMKHKFKVDELKDEEFITHEYTTEDLFEENKLLMDLTAQPEVIRNLIEQEIEYRAENTGTFDYFSFIRFCNKNDLEAVAESIDHYVPLLSGKRV